jgi:hypothetical protein
MQVRGYLKSGERALWWYLPDELYADYQVQPGDRIKGTLKAIYNAKGEEVPVEDRDFTWPASKETGFAVLVPADFAIKYQLTAFHFLEMEIHSIIRADGNQPATEVYRGEMKERKVWPADKMKLNYSVAFMAP